MKGLVIFHDHELSFCHADKDLEKYLKERWTLLQKSAGATDQDLEMKDFSSIYQEFLQPFCTAFDALASLKKTMHSISLEEGFMVVFKKVGQSLYIALSKGHNETEADLFKKIKVFNSILSFLVGPVKRRIRPREKIQKTLEQLLVTYEKLYDEDEVFLLEAVEHVTFGQLQAAQDVVVKLAKESLESSNNGGLTHVQHAMLIVNSKLLAICGKTPQLITSDMLLLTLFVCCFFSKEREEVVEEDREGEEYGDMEGIHPQTSVRADASPDRSEVFQTPPMSTPGSYREPEDPPFSTPGPETDPSFTTPLDEPESMASIRESSNPSRMIPSRLRNLFGLRNSRAGDADALEEEEAEESARTWKFVEQLVFLQPNTATFIPHRLHCLEVCPGIVLVLISEYGLNQLAGTISLILHHLDEIFNCNIRGGQSVFDMLEEHFRRTNSLVRHEVQVTASSTLRQCGNLVQNAWVNLKEAGLRQHITSSQIDDREVNPRLESSSSSLTRRLVELFEQLFFTPKQRDYDTAHVKSKLVRNFSGLRKDYGEFLALKGSMNIPMLNFSMCHPGMVHFILVDRSFDEMITPSVHRDQPVGVSYVEKLANEKHITSGELLKKTIWQMVKRSQKYLGHGYTSQTWLDQNFLYSYYAWINHHSLALNESRRYLPPTIKSSEGYPGVIGNSFYRDLAQGQCYVFELYCIHEAAVPIKIAAMQCRELANQLWPNTKAAIAPFSLIN